MSLFSGIGGFDLGFERAGMNCVAQVEFNKNAANVLKHHWPNVPHFEDVRNVGKDNLPAADLICGGFPCQDVSIAGSRAGLVGERSGLWFEFLRIIGEFKPRWIVIENVSGLLTSNNGRDFATVIHGLVKRGYRVGWRVLDAQYWDVPQRRERVFIVASLNGGSAAQVLFEREGLSGNINTSQPPQKSAAAGNGSSDTRTISDVIRSGVKVYDARGNGNGFIVPTLVGDHLNRITDYTPVILEENGARRLTPIECERLQGFPDNWTSVKNAADSPRYKQIGNAVAVPVAYWIGKRIMAAA